SLTRTEYRPPLSELGIVNVQVAAPLLSDEQVVGLVVSVVYEPDPGDVSIWRVRVWLAVKPVMVAVTVAPGFPEVGLSATLGMPVPALFTVRFLPARVSGV